MARAGPCQSARSAARLICKPKTNVNAALFGPGGLAGAGEDIGYRKQVARRIPNDRGEFPSQIEGDSCGGDDIRARAACSGIATMAGLPVSAANRVR